MSSLPGCCYVCNECPCSYATLDDLENHMDMMHSGSLRKESNEEIGTTEGENHIKGHESKTTVDDAKEDVGEQDVHETESGGNSPSSSDVSNFDGAMDGLGFAMDEVTSDEGRGFSCRFCPKVFEERQQLNVHYTLTHRDKPQYECEECHTIFAVKRELSTHMRIHSGEQPHTCTQCGKEFGTRQLLKKHWMWHTGERSHVCPHCGKAFFQVG
ncbi:hypothetical protein AB6A40_009277 [Gnathostoma spinigerum]|uniref:C2H2-type domain-containing protein n=1 Tax=Gnathostoma spinigerum TaxID=75299 RepID=A0ABD6ERJ7_9BILA